MEVKEEEEEGGGDAILALNQVPPSEKDALVHYYTPGQK